MTTTASKPSKRQAFAKSFQAGRAAALRAFGNPRATYGGNDEDDNCDDNTADQDEAEDDGDTEVVATFSAGHTSKQLGDGRLEVRRGAKLTR